LRVFWAADRYPLGLKTRSRALRDLLRAAGCTFVRQGRGSHEIWHSPITQRNFAVPVGIPSRHTANAILRQAGLPKAF
jgi:predicted RNA binding protein YcfA (HicA-like mRNA interferase family)